MTVWLGRLAAVGVAAALTGCDSPSAPQATHGGVRDAVQEQPAHVTSPAVVANLAPSVSDASTASLQQSARQPARVTTSSIGAMANTLPAQRAVPIYDEVQSPVAEARPPPRGYELIGTTLAPTGDSAVLRDRSNEEHRTVHAGDRIDDASVTEIRADRVVLTSAQGSELLLLAKRSSPPLVLPPEASMAASVSPDGLVQAAVAVTPPVPANGAASPIEGSPPANTNPTPIPQYTGPAGETPVYTEPAEEGQPTGH
jgi:hypothetical protein